MNDLEKFKKLAKKNGFKKVNKKALAKYNNDPSEPAFSVVYEHEEGFHIGVYTDDNYKVPEEWVNYDGLEISGNDPLCCWAEKRAWQTVFRLDY